MADQDHMNVVDVILDLKGGDPFEPFTIILTSGDRYLIEAGGNLVEMKTEFFYASPKTNRFVFMRKNLVAAVERSDERPAKRRKAS
jgi:hypothetical protein